MILKYYFILASRLYFVYYVIFLNDLYFIPLDYMFCVLLKEKFSKLIGFGN